MRFSHYLGLAATALASVVAAEDILMHSLLKEVEYKRALALGYTVKVVDTAEWKALTTADFAKFKAVVLADPNCVNDVKQIAFVEETKNVWTPAIAGNIIVIGTDPSYHSYAKQAGADILIDNSIKFAASGTAGTGLYFSLSCYYHKKDTTEVTALSGFGKFVVRGNLNCYNKVHIVARHAAMDSLSDVSLSNWRCSVHEAFVEYPISGVGGFEALAIAQDIMDVGSRGFGDGTNGLPYIISRGATPAGCGNGKYEPLFNEECDLGDGKNGAPGELCSASCKCLYGTEDAAAGTCKTKPLVGTGGTTGIIPSYTASTLPPYPTSSVAPHTDCSVIVGVEIIVVVTVSTHCPIGSNSTTTYSSSSTLQRPIYGTSVSGLPCYPCAIGTPSSGAFMTVSYTSCSTATPTLTYKMCDSCTAHTTCTDVPGLTPGASCSGCTGYATGEPRTYATPTTGSVPETTLTGRLPVKPTTSAVFATAGAGKNAVAAGMGLLGGLAALAAL